MSDIVIKTAPKAEMKVSIKVEGGNLPSTGNVGDVLTKTEFGTEWRKPTGSVKTVNGVSPDKNGNVELPAMEIPEVDLSGMVRSVNGIAPDESGNVTLNVSIEDSEIIDMMIELNAFPAVMDADGAFLADSDGSILLM